MASLTLASLRTEVIARGFDYLPASRINRFLNEAVWAINDLEAWGYLQATTTGVAPVTVTDLGRIEYVVDLANLNPLAYMDRRDIIDLAGSTVGTGQFPLSYFITGTNTVNAWPVTGVTLTVAYVKSSAELTNDADEPAIPDRFRYAIVDYAVAMCLEDVSNFSEAQAARTSGDVIVSRMREWDLLQQGASNQQMIYGAAEDWC